MIQQTKDDFRTASERVADCVKELHGRHDEVTREMVSKRCSSHYKQWIFT